MTARELPARRTVVSPVEVYMALRLQLEAQLGREQTTRAGTVILLGQMALETARFEATMNYNFGGVKCSPKWPGCWQHFTTTEHFAEAEAARYIAEAPPGTKVERIGVDDTGKVILRFSGRHPMTKFRAYETLDDAVASHVRFLLGARYRNAVHLAMAGRADDYAQALRVAGYYTGDAATYARSVRKLAREYDEKMPKDSIPAPPRPSEAVVSVAASVPAPMVVEAVLAPVAPPQPSPVAPPPVAPVELPRIGEPAPVAVVPWWLRLLRWLLRA